MTPSESFTEFFQWFKLREVHTKIELLFKIALTTENGCFDSPEEREDLFFFKEELTKCIDAARRLATI
jgi:hypothetical protein